MNLILLIVVVLSGCVLMTLIAPHDIALSTWLYERKAGWLVNLMSDSVFELEMIGGGDLIVFFAVLSLLLYVGSSLIDVDCSTHRLLFSIQTWMNRRPQWTDWLRRQRFRLEFLVVSTFCCSTLMVKLLKWTMARPRPKKYFWGTRPFYEWWEVGPYFLDEGSYRASFPSGHTASVITLMALVYVLLFSFGDRPRRRSGGMLLLFTLAFAAVMAVARVMTRAHWPTDVTFSIFGGWVLIHILFFYGLRVASGGAAAAPAEFCPPPPFRAIRLCWYLTLFSLSLAGLFIGLRHVLNDRWPWLGLAALASLPLLVYSVVKSREEGLFSDRFS
jgi:membrane-associated phospholipid phosphatase